MKTPQDNPAPTTAPTTTTTTALPHTPGTRAITAAAIEQTCSLLQELGSIASAAMSVSRCRTADLDELDDLHTRMHAVQLMVDRMGWVADVGLRTLGGQPNMARAEDWMLPGMADFSA